MVAIAIIFSVNVMLTMMSDIKEGDEPKNSVIFPITLFGIGHAMFTTLQGPSIK